MKQTIRYTDIYGTISLGSEYTTKEYKITEYDTGAIVMVPIELSDIPTDTLLGMGESLNQAQSSYVGLNVTAQAKPKPTFMDKVYGVETSDDATIDTYTLHELMDNQDIKELAEGFENHLQYKRLDDTSTSGTTQDVLETMLSDALSALIKQRNSTKKLHTLGIDAVDVHEYVDRFVCKSVCKCKSS